MKKQHNLQKDYYSSQEFPKVDTIKGIEEKIAIEKSVRYNGKAVAIFYWDF